MVKDPAVRVSNSLGILFPEAWLEAKAEGDPSGRTNWEVETEVCSRISHPSFGRI